MAIKATPSCDYPFVLVPEDQPAFRDHASAKRELKRQWAAQEPADRSGYFLAKVEDFLEPDYGIEVHQEPVCPPSPGGEGGGSGPGTGSGSERKPAR
jgi:hypothetical protein